MRPRIKRIVLFSGLCILAFGCSDRQNLVVFADSVIEIPDLTVTATCSNDPLAGEGAKSYVFVLSNGSGISLHRCILEVNDAYTVRLEEIEVYESFWRGNRPRNDSDIPPGGKIRIVFSHDNNNNRVFRDEKGSMLPRDVQITNFSIQTEEGTKRWVFAYDGQEK